MLAYLIRRLLLIIPTLFGIMVINFLVVQILPGGPVEQVIAEITGQGVGATSRVSTTVMICAAAMASPAVPPYARISPPLPSFVPPKYRVTTMTTPHNSAPSMWFRMG